MWSIVKQQYPAIIEKRGGRHFLRSFCRRLSNLFLPAIGFERQVARALRLQPRGGILNDGMLPIETISARIKIVCRARAPHPWDKDLPVEAQHELFARQCLKDVDNAVRRVFQRLRGVEEIDMTILTPDGRTKIMSGLVSRENLSGRDLASPGMRLLVEGMEYRLNDYRFDPIL